ncbi:putative flavonol 3-O-glucosyltransferase [Medicago truncatula]|uniref:Putative flavonol 3-O-glucosyltransferase n=1 Tax=Medicago truncatula TaxID=3880 RepID=A0A396HYH7_MEDTR|nr:putative flavonol 3-O-glucosyltransferase [Medicago truncatula]
MKFPHTAESDVYAKSIPISDSLHVINLPEVSVLPTSDPGSDMNALLEAHKANVKQAISNLTTGEQHGPLAAVIVDMFCTNMIDVAKEFSLPAFVLFTSGIAFLGLNLYIQYLFERDSTDSTQLMQLTELPIPSFANPFPLNSLPSSVLHKEYKSVFMSFAKGLKNADGIIVNSFEELESYAVHSFFSHPELAGLSIYPIGPILNLEPKTKGTVDSDDIVKWLDDQPPSSVKGIALAVENTGVRIVWSLRKPPPKGTMVAPSDYPLSDLSSVLPEGFLDRTEEIGRVIGWAPQTQTQF